MCSESEIDSYVSVDRFIRAGHCLFLLFFLMDTARLKVSIMAALIDRCPKIGDFSHSLSHRSGPLVVFYVIFILYPVCSILRSLPYTSTFIVSYTHGLSQMKRDHREI